MVNEFILSAIYQLLWHAVIIALGILLSKVFREDIVAGGGESVRAHSAVVFLLVSGLATGRETHDHISRTDVGVVDDIAPLHAAGDGAVHDDGPHEVAHVGCLAACAIDANAHVAKLLHELVGAVDDGRYYLTRDEHLVAAYRGGNQDVIDGAHAEQVVGIHDERVLSDAFPNAQITRLFPIHIGEARLRASPVSMHDVAVLRITTEDVGDYLAESLREDTLVDVLDGVVNVLFCSAHTAHHIALIVHKYAVSVCFRLQRYE